MTAIIDRLKAQARVLHREASAGHASAIARLRAAGVREPEFQRRHCLQTLARELGFRGWSHATQVLGGSPADDYGTLLYPAGCSAYQNIWFAAYGEAREVLEQHHGYLLPYKRHVFIAEPGFVSNLGLDADDPDWQRIGRDWVCPQDPSARARLYERVVLDHQRQRQQAARAAG